MNITPELAVKISERIRNYVSLPSHGLEEAISVALSIEALPLYLDVGGVFAVKPTGEIVVISSDEPHTLRIEDDPRICNIVFFQGSKKYPELSELVLSKPINAQLCPYCKGTGIAPTPPGVSGDQFVCYCGGLGWIP
jgi:hypothetical protein